MPRPRKRYSAEFKSKIALEAIKGQKTTNELAAEYGVHPNQIAHWKKQALDELPSLFTHGADQASARDEKLVASLYQQIGQLSVEVDFLKKKSGRLS